MVSGWVRIVRINAVILHSIKGILCEIKKMCQIHEAVWRFG